MNVLAIGSHPDDIEIGCFATMAKHKMDGDNVYGVCVTKGEIGGNVEVRMREATEAAKVIGMELIFGDFPDGYVEENAKLITFLDKIVKDKKIDILYTHSEHDRHQDHRAVAQAGLSVSRNVQEVYCYEACSLISHFTPHVFVDVTETFGYKLTALRKYESQKNRTYADGLEGIGRFRASQARLPGRLCEAFEAYKILRNENSPKYIETFDLRNQIKVLKKALSEVEVRQENRVKNLIDAEKDELLKSSDLLPEQEKKLIVDVVSKQSDLEKFDIMENKQNLNIIEEVRNEMKENKKEIENLRNELKVYKDALLLKKEINLYKEAIENAKKSERDSQKFQEI
ncbi:MAG: PIG-L family deacetylase [Nitrosopumilaceae archaeon]